MVRVLYKSDVDGSLGDIYYYRFAGNSNDSKPTATVSTGSRFLEVDTGKKYRFSESSGEWTETNQID